MLLTCKAPRCVVGGWAARCVGGGGGRQGVWVEGVGGGSGRPHLHLHHSHGFKGSPTATLGCTSVGSQKNICLSFFRASALMPRGRCQSVTD